MEIQKISEAASLGLTVPTIILALAVVRAWGHSGRVHLIRGRILRQPILGDPMVAALHQQPVGRKVFPLGRPRQHLLPSTRWRIGSNLPSQGFLRRTQRVLLLGIPAPSGTHGWRCIRHAARILFQMTSNAIIITLLTLIALLLAIHGLR